MTNETTITPAVLRMRELIDGIFVQYMGPIAIDVCGEEFDRWRAEGRTGASSLHRYIFRLSKHIDDENTRRTFLKEAGAQVRL